MAEDLRMLTCAQFAWLQKVSPRRIRMLAAQARIAGARKFGRDWLIPASADVVPGARGPRAFAVRTDLLVGARAFPNPGALSAYQLDREVEQALRVQQMSPRQRSAWLSRTWGPLQRQMPAVPDTHHRGARAFRSLSAKNRFEQAREIDDALALALSRSQG